MFFINLYGFYPLKGFYLTINGNIIFRLYQKYLGFINIKPNMSLLSSFSFVPLWVCKHFLSKKPKTSCVLFKC